MGWLHEHEPINVYDEMDWIANRSRAELRGKPRHTGSHTQHTRTGKADRLHCNVAPSSVFSLRYVCVCVCVIAATLEQIIRQERDNLVMKLNSVVQRYTRQVAD